LTEGTIYHSEEKSAATENKVQSVGVRTERRQGGADRKAGKRRTWEGGGQKLGGIRIDLINNLWGKKRGGSLGGYASSKKKWTTITRKVGKIWREDEKGKHPAQES